MKITDQQYRIHLEVFEGPMDLLLFLIRKNEVDIYDIPIATITRQYMEYIEAMKILDLEVASEFILMASSLIRVKVQMLLPRSPSDEDGEDELDPRQELVQRLLEYKMFKEMSQELVKYEELQLQHFDRRYFAPLDDDEEAESLDAGQRATLFELLKAFHEVVRKSNEHSFHQVTDYPVTVEDQVKFILGALDDGGEVRFQKLMMSLKEKMKIIITFIAILELVRKQQIVVRQSASFSEIWITRAA